MAYTTGIATDYKDLLAIMATFAAANGWSILDQSETQLYIRGTGLAGLDEIYCGVQTAENVGSSIYNWRLFASWGYDSSKTYYDQPKSCYFDHTSMPCAMFWNNAIPYWMVANGRRIIVFAKVGTGYRSTHLGLLTPCATDAQNPYPLLIGGNNTACYSYTSSSSEWWKAASGGNARVHCPNGAWGGFNLYTYNYYYCPLLMPSPVYSSCVDSGILGKSPDGEYLLEPIRIIGYDNSPGDIFGEVEGLFRISGYDQTSENIITVDGVNYMAFQNGINSGNANFCALRLN